MANEMVKYTTDHGEITLTSKIVRDYLVPSDSRVTDQEIGMFLKLCEYQKLNPFLREAYLVKYGDFPASIVTGKEVFTKRAMKREDYAGLQAGITVLRGDKLERREGSLLLHGEELVAGWAKVFVKGKEVPFFEEVSKDEYEGRKKDGTPTGMWATKPATMLRKVAIVHALREAFPQDYEGLYSPEEINTVDMTTLPDKPVHIDTSKVVELDPIEQDEPKPEPKRTTWEDVKKKATPVQVATRPPVYDVHPASEMTLTFGKHKGKKLCEIESGYLEWLVQQPVREGKYEQETRDRNEKIKDYLDYLESNQSANDEPTSEYEDDNQYELPFDLDELR